MALTQTSTLRASNAFGKVIPAYWADFIRENLWSSLFFRQLGTKVVIPEHYGDTVKIPRWTAPYLATAEGEVSANAGVTAVTNRAAEATVVTPSVLSAETISGQVVLFDGAIGYTDLAVLISYANIVEGGVENLTRELARRLDNYTRTNISANASHQLAGGGVLGTNKTANPLRGKFVSQIPATMDSWNVPRWDDQTFVGVCHPRAQYDLYSDISATGFVSIANYGRPEDIYRGEIGRMYGVRFLLSNNVPLRKEAGATSATTGLSGGVTGADCWVFAPDSFYGLELAQGGVQVIHHPPGSAGADDPTNIKGTVGIKVYYGVAAAPSGDRRLMLFTHKLGLDL